MFHTTAAKKVKTRFMPKIFFFLPELMWKITVEKDKSHITI